MSTLVMLAATFLSAGEVPVTLWIEAREADGGIQVPHRGEYALWAWTSADAAIDVGGKTVQVKAERGEKDPEFVWRKGGTVELDAGVAPVTLAPAVATIALTTVPDFDPLLSQQHRRVMDEPISVGDQRALRVRHTDTVFTMPGFESMEAWEACAAPLRRRVLLSSGLYPMPERTPLNAKIFDKVTHDDYTVEKAYFEAWPGFYVTGNLYRPTGQGPFPAVVGPHGHWGTGRLEDGENGSVPARHITFARMGIVAFSYDMIGYNDSKQFPHRWGGKMEKLWSLHPFALQLWSSIRVVDFLSELPDVDSNRIAATGASGGGTQTFSLTAVDPRIVVSAPVNMISSTMQGGCLCENAPILRLDNSNMEIGALMAPKPLLMVSATGDWTRETPRVEYPAIRSIYSLYGADDRVKNVHITADHNYNQDSREAVYQFFGKWLLDEEPQYAEFKEPAYTIEDEAALRVFPDALPEGSPTSEQILESIRNLQRERLEGLYPSDAASLARFRETYDGVLAEVVGAKVLDPWSLTPERRGRTQGDPYWTERWLIHRPMVDDAVPAILYRASTADVQDATLVVRDGGKAPSVSEAVPLAEVQDAIAHDRAVLVIDLYLEGEHHSPFEKTEQTVVGEFSDTFQPTLAGNQVQDILTAIAFLRSRRDLSGDVELVATGRAGILALVAAAIDGGVTSVHADLNNFDVNDDGAWVDNYYIPCMRSVGDVATAGVLLAPASLELINVHPSFPIDTVRAAYRAAEAEDRLVVKTPDMP